MQSIIGFRVSYFYSLNCTIVLVIESTLSFLDPSNLDRTLFYPIYRASLINPLSHRLLDYPIFLILDLSFIRIKLPSRVSKVSIYYYNLLRVLCTRFSIPLLKSLLRGLY